METAAIVIRPTDIKFGTANFQRTVRRGTDLSVPLLEIVGFCASRNCRSIRICGEMVGKAAIEAIRENHPSIEIVRINQTRALIHALASLEPIQTIGDFQLGDVYGILDCPPCQPELKIGCWQVGSHLEMRGQFKDVARICHFSPETRQAALLCLAHLSNVAIFLPTDDTTDWEEAYSATAPHKRMLNLGLYAPPDLITAVLQIK